MGRNIRVFQSFKQRKSKSITDERRQDDNFVEIAVSDTGIGMTQERMEELFRIDTKSSRQGTVGEEGTGLGLILCKEFIDKNGGTIRVESEVNNGSRFIVSLPRRELRG